MQHNQSTDLHGLVLQSIPDFAKRMTKRLTGFVCLLIFFMLTSGSVYAGNDAWTSLGPNGGYITCLAVDSHPTSILYAGTEYGGILKSTDGGSTWNPSSFGLGNIEINVIQIDANSPTTLYAGTDGQGMFKSTDGGATWNHINTGLTHEAIYSIAIDPITPTILYAGTLYGYGLFKSTDGGDTWNAINPGFINFNILSITIDQQNPATLYVGTNNGVFKSTDSGTNWNAIGLSGKEVQSFIIDPLSDILYAGTYYGGVFKSTDSGTTWNSSNTGLPVLNIEALDFDPSNPTRLYAAVENNGVFKSTDGGASWSAGNNGLTNLDVRTLAIDQFQPTTLYAGAYSDGVAISTDSGTNWDISNNSFTDLDIMALLVDPASTTTLYVSVYDLGIYKSTDGGITWNTSNTGLGYFDIRAFVMDPVSSSTLYAGTYGEGVYKSINGGASWSAFNNGMDWDVRALVIDPITPSILYVGADYSGMYKTSDGGATWNAISNGLTSLEVRSLAIDPVTPANIYAGTLSGGVFKSTDSGANWSAISNGLTTLYVKSLAVNPVTPTTVYAGTRTGGVFKSTDSGANWSVINNGLTDLNIQDITIDPVTPTTVYAGSDNGGVFKSTDGGANWSEFNEGLTVFGVDALVFEPGAPNKLYAGTYNGIFKITQSTGTPVAGSINGTVSVNGNGLSGVEVTLLDTTGTPVTGFDSEFTDDNGQYSFDNVSPDIYLVSITEPLGYSAQENPVSSTLASGASNIVDFVLEQAVIRNKARSAFWWTQQFRRNLCGNHHVQVSEQDLINYIDDVQAHYTPHFDIFQNDLSLVDWLHKLQVWGNFSQNKRARRQLAALVMNLVSGKVGQYTVVTRDGRTAGDVLTYVSILVTDGDPSNDHLAVELARKVNLRRKIKSGIIPAGNILYKGGEGFSEISYGFGAPKDYKLEQNYPNPFNPTTMIQFSLPQAGSTTLNIYNMVGELVRTLVSGGMEAGGYSIQWDGTNDNGYKVASGIYIYRLDSGSFSQVKKMMLLK